MHISASNEIAIKQYIQNTFDTSSPMCFVQDFNNINKQQKFADFITSNLRLSFNAEGTDIKDKNQKIVSFNKIGIDRIMPAINLIIKTLKTM